MVSPFVMLRRWLLVVLSAGLLAVAGCKSGVNPGEGPGIKSFADGELNGNVMGPLSEVRDVMMQTLVDMGVMNATHQQNSVLVEINARTLQDVPVEIKISRISDTLTKLRIRAGEGDRDLARSIYDRVRQQMDLRYQ